ncbi:MAG TPA: amino acid adenylation domain-containing protein [Jatrophihabitans sp.]|nr:amino acid adenylation domain-containing protein [Jatrophihabitans sp.]
MLSSLIGDLARAGVTVRLAPGDRLEVAAPKGVLTADLRDRILAEKADLIDWLGRAAHDERPPRLPVDPAGWAEPFPPSDLQVSYLVGSAAGLEYHVRPHQYMEWDVPAVDPARLERALNLALRRQRANLVLLRDDLQLQAVPDPEPVRVGVSDARTAGPQESQALVEQVRDRMQWAQLPLDRWPWLELHVTLLPDDRARIHYNHNNFFCDGPSLALLLRDLWHYYDRPDNPLPELTVGYRDCMRAFADREQATAGQAARAYWLDRIPGWPDAPALPVLGRGRDRARLHRRDLVLSRDEWAGLTRHASTYGLTPTTSMYGAYAELLGYWSGSRHFLLNTMITHREPLHPQIGDVLGNFAALYPLEVDWRPDEPFRARVRRIAAQVLADLAHTAWPGTRVLQSLNAARATPGRAACPFVVGSGLFMGTLDRPAFSRLETPQVLLDCQFWEQSDGSLWVVWDVFEDQFPPGLVDAMHEAFGGLLRRLATDAAAWETTAFDLLPDAQRADRRQNNLSTAPLPVGPLHRGLAVAAATRPGHPYLVTAGRSLDFAETDRRVRRLAATLAAAGVGPGDRVALVLTRGWRQVVGTLATLTLGAVYIPVDPRWPDRRIGELLDHTAAVAVLAEVAAGERLQTLTGVPVVAVPDEIGADLPGSAAAVAVEVAPDSPAYVIFTSGSTGRPKGAVLDHRGPLNTVVDVNRRYGVTEADVLFGVSSPSFDLSVYDVFGALDAGATVVLSDPDDGPADWLRLMLEHRATVWNSVPALMELLVTEAVAAGVTLPDLRVVLLSGDWVPTDLPARVRAVAPGAMVISLGGATEASIWSIAHPVEDADQHRPSIPYGRPMANQTWHVLDAQGRDSPIWTAGDLFIGGVGLAAGYLADPDRTAAAFVTHPRTGERLYRTGDRGRYLPSGEIEFLGRSDLQVKVQGFRVEPGEIEHALAEHPDVDRAAVVARRAAGGRQLAAFVTARPGTILDPASLLEHLAGRLPGYLVPSHLEVLPRLPLSATGKVDRVALETLPGAAADNRAPGRYVPPRGRLEELLVAAWQEILSVDRVGVTDDFFQLGGQSFAALRLVSTLRERLGRPVPLGALLEARTVANLARWLETGSVRWSPLVRLAEGPAPAFFVHPAGGDVLCYRQLAELIDGGCHALQAPGPAVGRPPPVSVDELAAEYLPALRAARPAGPYRLGGWSSGATIALELAHRLEHAGERVERLVVIDAPAPTVRRELDEGTVLLWFLADLDIGFDPDRVPPRKAGWLAARPPEERLDAALALAAELGAQVGDPAGLRDLYPVFAGVVRAGNAYRPSAITADITLIRAGRGCVPEFRGHPAADRPDWGWAALTSGRVAAITVDADHHNLLRGPRLAAVAAAVTGRGRHD